MSVGQAHSFYTGPAVINILGEEREREREREMERRRGKKSEGPRALDGLDEIGATKVLVALAARCVVRVAGRAP